MAAHVHGLGRISAALVAAPAAGLLASLAAAAVLPASPEIRLLTWALAGFPAAAAAPCFALLAKSGARAWAGSAVTAAAAGLALVLA